ncbi:ArsR/SmtB family transcription factor [Luteipulveratus mongoliensis]|uniref:ArsR family transcriptional regulator n=1 Tax=Luteipulveratus mongoliensis TaxID=571913 RepID=A0A0K1JMB7_9MICO|nr:metalloregulator ArsR/SmtB family transcription factor [Luteipulveratus mongoliensis]AKU17718.1 ArsR family transcriptional regulator [Luteipulveratus mongoliensis]
MEERDPEVAAERASLVAAACFFKSLGDPTRLMIIRRLAAGEHRVADLVADLGLAQPTVSKHLRCLRDCGLVLSRPEGAAAMYRLAYPDLVDVLRSAEPLLARTGDAVVLCPSSGVTA